MSYELPVATVEKLRDYLDWQVQCGHGLCVVTLDRRGIEFLNPNKHEVVGIGVPPDGERHDDKLGRIFVRAVF